jgi:hypothetical protein
MEEMIQRRLQIISDLKEELNSLKENYVDILEEDPLYQEVQEKALEVREEKQASKTRLMSNATYYRLTDEIKDKRREIRENREALSQELVELYKKEGKMEIVDPEGNVKRMKFSVRLVNG